MKPLGMTAKPPRHRGRCRSCWSPEQCLLAARSPTYGTDKTASDQLVSDVSGILSLGAAEAYQRRLQASSGACAPEQGGDRIAARAAGQRRPHAGNAAWVESPEEKRARLRAEADENSDDPSWRPQIDADMARSLPRASAREESSVTNIRAHGVRRAADGHEHGDAGPAVQAEAGGNPSGQSDQPQISERTADSIIARRRPPRRSANSARTSSRRNAA